MKFRPLLLFGLVALLFAWSFLAVNREGASAPANRERVLFWHFWGGGEREAVRKIVARFNASQEQYWVEEIPIPGQNLDMKLFMSVAGGETPDLVNQDDQVVAQWAEQGVLTPLRELTQSEDEYNELQQWLTPAARKIGSYNGQLFALCNALDIRTLFYRKDALGSGAPPKTIADLDQLALRELTDENRIPYLPDDRRLWAWGTVFGGDFYDESTGKVTANDGRIVAALEWMVSYTKFHGLQTVRTFRSTNREVGAGSMLLDGRYGLMMDGQWRVPQLDAAIQESNAAGNTPMEYGVAPLPAPPEGNERAGWANGNFFLVPKNAKHKAGAWAFMKFWSGFGGHEKEAAISAAAGGWVPASSKVVEQPAFQNYLKAHPNFRLFVELAQSDTQRPTPVVPGQSYFFERVNLATEEAMSLTKTPQEALNDATRDIQEHLDRLKAKQ